MTDVTISLISTNERHQLDRLFPSLMPAARLVDAEVRLVDHGSSDGTSDYVKRNFPEVQVLYNGVRSSYGENHNLNLHEAKGRYFAIMNTDVVIETPNIFRYLRDFLDRDPSVGMASPKVLNEDGTIQGLNKRYPTVLDLFLRRFLPTFLQPVFQRRLDYYEMRDFGYDHDYDVPFLSGAFMFCRTDLLKSLGGFNPRYRMFFDDVDLCRRVQLTHRSVYCHEVCITHFWRRIAHKKWSQTFQHGRMAYRYFAEWGFRFF